MHNIEDQESNLLRLRIVVPDVNGDFENVAMVFGTLKAPYVTGITKTTLGEEFDRGHEIIVEGRDGSVPFKERVVRLVGQWGTVEEIRPAA